MQVKYIISAYAQSNILTRFEGVFCCIYRIYVSMRRERSSWKYNDVIKTAQTPRQSQPSTSVGHDVSFSRVDQTVVIAHGPYISK